MKKITQILALCLAPGAVLSSECVMQDKVITRSAVVISERTTIRRDVVPSFANQRRCMVDFRVRVGNEWHTAFGEYTWDGVRPDDQACAVAVSRAEEDVRHRIGQVQSVSEKTLICKDQPKLNTLHNSSVGTVGDVGQFRPHPDYPERFYHRGTQCKWFVESAFTGRDMRVFQGIICAVNDGKWVVVDKF